MVSHSVAMAVAPRLVEEKTETLEPSMARAGSHPGRLDEADAVSGEGRGKAGGGPTSASEPTRTSSHAVAPAEATAEPSVAQRTRLGSNAQLKAFVTSTVLAAFQPRKVACHVAGAA